MAEEKVIFRGSPSQILNADVLGISAVILAALIIGAIFLSPWVLAGLPIVLAFAGWKWIQLRCRVYELTNERLRVSHGVITRHTEELELYRVVDVSLVEPFFLRWLGLGNVVITTNDRSTPVITIPAIHSVRELREQLRTHVESCRDRKRVRLTELESDSPDAPQ
jgi:uncharacterized membrane protein YdbT with pleckstrin-like domain